MPTYNFKCLKCDKIEEHFTTISKRDEPRLCSCGKEGNLKRCVDAPAMSYQGAKSAIKRAGSEWNDVLKKVKKASGRENTIEHY